MRKVLYIFAELEDSDLQWLIDAGTSRPVLAGVDLIEKEVAPNSLFIVVDGQLSVNNDGVEIAQLGPGEVLGDMSLLDSRPPAATVTATEDSTVFAIPQGLLRTKLAQDTEFAARFYRALCIFLANRLSRTAVMVGASSKIVDEKAEVDDEIPPDALQNIALAGARFDWFMQRIGGK